jgi:hypothetical protein
VNMIELVASKNRLGVGATIALSPWIHHTPSFRIVYRKSVDSETFVLETTPFIGGAVSNRPGLLFRGARRPGWRSSRHQETLFICVYLAARITSVAYRVAVSAISRCRKPGRPHHRTLFPALPDRR